MAILVIEQNIGVATQMSDPVAIMVNGRINRVIGSAALAADRDLQQRLLGVGRHGHEEAGEGAPAESTAAAAPRTAGPTRVYMANPVLPTRWSQDVPAARIEAEARTLSRPVLRLSRAGASATSRRSPRAPLRSRMSSSPAPSTPRATSSATSATSSRPRD